MEIQSDFKDLLELFNPHKADIETLGEKTD